MTKLADFIIEARKRDFTDKQIRTALLNHKWPKFKIDRAFNSLVPKLKVKNQVCVFLNNQILTTLSKRAKKNSMTLGEQIEDILRRSSVRKSGSSRRMKIDDFLVSVFSRAKTRPLKKKRKKK